MQALLDEGDRAFFDRNPLATGRRRLYFKGEAITGEAITGAAHPSRSVVVTRAVDGGLVRRFLAETAGDA